MKTTLVLMFILLFANDSIYSKENKPLIIDIGSLEPNSVFSSIDNGAYSYIIVKNTLAGAIYNIEVNKEKFLLPELKYDVSGLYEANRVPDNCRLLNKAITDLRNYQVNRKKELREEKILAELVMKVEEELKKENCDLLKSIAEVEIKKTYKYYPQEIKAEPGEKVTITIKRDSLTWTYILKGESLGKWVTTYGFGFISSVLESPTYYTEQNSTDSKYQILKSRSPNVADMSYIPAIFFSYFPNQNFTRCWNHSLTGGLGFDLSAPVIFFGYNGLFWQNIGFSAGVAFQQQYRLKSQYSEGDIVDLTLEKDQLHDKIYRPNLFVAVNFRFGENPFKSNNQKAKE